MSVGIFIGRLFPGYEVKGSGTFRIIRDSDIEVEEESEDLVRFFETALKRRRRGSVIRIETDSEMPASLRQFVVQELGVPSTASRPAGPAGAQHAFRDHQGAARRSANSALQCAISRTRPRACRRLLRRHPRKGHGRPSPLRILRRGGAVPAPGCARSGRGLAIKQTLYRTSNDSPIVRALIDAAESGKSVTALVELKARFDEEPTSAGRATSSAPACRSSSASSN
jgi:polyphosphate kinase